MQLKGFMKITKVQDKLLILLILVWVFISLVRLGFYMTQTAFELSSSDRYNLFGDLGQNAETIIKQTPKNEEILLVSHDGWAYFLLRYLVYPRRIRWSEEQNKLSAYRTVILDERGHHTALSSAEKRYLKLSRKIIRLQ